MVSTASGTRFDKHLGFIDAEAKALTSYLGHPECIDEACSWYDGYRFDNMSIVNPWSVLNYLDRSCTPDVYWGNTSGNAVLGDMFRHADEATLQRVYSLPEPKGRSPLPLTSDWCSPMLGLGLMCYRACCTQRDIS